MHKLLEVFTQDYRRETEYREFVRAKLEAFKLNNQSESVDSKIGRLKALGFESKFVVKVGKFS